jgi:hypothetical protein
MADRDGVEGRIDSYFDTIGTMARRGAFSGRPGSWINIEARARGASRRWRRTQACHPGLHARFMEFELWGQILGACVLPDRHQALATAIHRVGAEEARDDVAEVETLLEVICPERHEAAGSPARARPSLDEIAVVRQLQNAERLSTVSALDAALRATVGLGETVGREAGLRHAKCEPWPVLTVSHVLARSLRETMPRPQRMALAHFAQHQFFATHAPEDAEPEFFQQAPAFPLPEDADPLWCFSPTWQYIPQLQTGEDGLDPGLAPWLIEDVEVPLRLDIEDAVKRRRELKQRLALLGAG